jgi:hypothetical protein
MHTISFSTEIATSVTIVLVGVILTGYVSVLKRNGWIGRIQVETGLSKSMLQNPSAVKIQHSDPLPSNAEGTSKNIENKKAKTPEKIPPTIEPKETKKIPKEPQKKTPELPKNQPEGCRQYFGYLSTLPKGKNPPDECFCCTDLINCYKRN